MLFYVIEVYCFPRSSANQQDTYSNPSKTGKLSTSSSWWCPFHCRGGWIDDLKGPCNPNCSVILWRFYGDSMSPWSSQSMIQTWVAGRFHSWFLHTVQKSHPIWCFRYRHLWIRTYELVWTFQRSQYPFKNLNNNHACKKSNMGNTFKKANPSFLCV